MRNDGKNTAVQKVVTKEALIEAFKTLGLSRNMNIEVHASLSSLGFVTGGARTVVDALMDVVTEGGTILMPTQTTDNTDPASWENPPALPSVWEEIRDSMPPYNPEFSDLTGMGAVAENFRHRAGVMYSNHPVLSFAAWGRYARVLCNRQSMHFPLAEESPIARLYELRGHVVLIGVDFTAVTCMHLAEYRTENRPIVVSSACTLIDGERTWKRYLDLDLDSSGFEQIKAEMDKKNMVRETMLNDCRIQMFRVNDAVDTATAFFEKNSVFGLYR